MPPEKFWEYTLAENILIVKGAEARDSSRWNHTSSLMSLYANSNASKGKRFKPTDFHPYHKMQIEEQQPKTRKDVDQLIEKLKRFNG